MQQRQEFKAIFLIYLFIYIYISISEQTTYTQLVVVIILIRNTGLVSTNKHKNDKINFTR